MSDGFGARLRRRREEQGIALLTIAGHTKINLSLLEGLERDDVSRWPSGIFRRAYVRSYAQAIGLDPELTAAEFREAYPDPEEVVTTEAIAAALESGRAGAAPPTRFGFFLGSALGSLTRRKRTPEVGARAEAQIPAHAPVTATLCHEPDLLLDIVLEPEPVHASDSEEARRDDESIRADESRPASTHEPIDQPGEDAPVAVPAPFEPDFAAVAALCTGLGRAGSPGEVQRLLGQGAEVLDASGLIVWLWDRWVDGLRPSLVHGYADAVVAQLPIVRREADNAVAAAFRSARTCAIEGGPDASDALASPLLTPDGCAGVLAIELQHGCARMPSVRAATTILAAQLSTLADRPWRDEADLEADSTVSDDALVSAAVGAPVRR